MINEGLQRSNRAAGARNPPHKTEDPWNDCIKDFHWGWRWLDLTPNPFFFLSFALPSLSSLCRWWAHLAWWWSRRWSCTRASTPKRGRTTLQHGTAFSAQVLQHRHKFLPITLKKNAKCTHTTTPRRQIAFISQSSGSVCVRFSVTHKPVWTHFQSKG